MTTVSIMPADSMMTYNAGSVTTAHLTWIPGWLRLMDFKFDAGLVASKVLSMMPSDYFRRQIFTAAFPDDPGVRQLADYVGSDNIVFSSDGPTPTASRSAG